MKKPLEITLSSIHLGSARRVVALSLDGKKPVEKFLKEKKRSDQKGFDKLYARIRAVAEHDRYENQLTFRSLKNGLYEFKTKCGLRLLAFYDELPDDEPQLIITALGTTKNSDQKTAIQKARTLKDEYFRRKNLPNTILKPDWL